MDGTSLDTMKVQVVSWVIVLGGCKLFMIFVYFRNLYNSTGCWQSHSLCPLYPGAILCHNPFLCKNNVSSSQDQEEYSVKSAMVRSLWFSFIVKVRLIAVSLPLAIEKNYDNIQYENKYTFCLKGGTV